MSEFFPADHPTPFPEKELLELAEMFETNTKHTKGYFKVLSETRARICREALASHAALRDRCLIAELKLTQQSTTT